MTPPPDEARVIAGKLTIAERDAMIALHESEWRTWPDTRLAAMLNGLGRRGISTLRDLGLASPGHPGWRLTPLGQQVRAILLETPDAE